MDKARNAAKQEKILLALTLCFVLILLACFVYEQGRQRGAGITVTTQWNTAPEVQEVQPIDLNLADVQELATLPGIGEALAQRIVEDREANGAFSSVDEITRVSGIGAGKLEGLRDYVSVSGKEKP